MSAPASKARARWAGHAHEVMTRHGHRAGAARAAVIEALAASGCCLSAQELADAARAAGRRVGIASVYRILERLHELRLVQRLELGDGIARFEALAPDGDHHHHLVCLECGEVVPFEDPGLERAIAGTSRRAGFSVVEHDVVLRGHCPACAA